MMRISLEGKTVLSLCGGDGEEADFQRCGARVTVTDLSCVALRAAHVRNPALECVCMDAEALTFTDASLRLGYRQGRPSSSGQTIERIP